MARWHSQRAGYIFSMTQKRGGYVFEPLDPVRLRSPYSIKWQLYGAEVLPLWVADMDFPVAPEILDALRERLDHWLGYPPRNGDPKLLEAIIQRQKEHGWGGLEASHLWLISGVVPGLYAACLGLASAGDEVLTQVPIYPPFLTAVGDHGRVARHNPLIQTSAGYQIDFDQLESLVTPAARILLLCNPHNPTGRVWTRPELERLAEFALKHRLYVVSDELHADLVLEGTHIPFASISPEISGRTVTLTGPCKTFNTAGLGIGAAISQNPALLERMKKATAGVMAHPNAMSMAMWLAGLERGGPWRQAVLAYLRANRDYLASFLKRELPQVNYFPPQATYLAWLDFRAFPFARDIHKILLQEAGVGLNDGPPFGPGSEGFLRLNFAASRPVLQQALEQIASTLKSKTP